MQINVRNASWDLMHYGGPYDYKTPPNARRTSNWTAGIQKNVYYDGTINNPVDRGISKVRFSNKGL